MTTYGGANLDLRKMGGGILNEAIHNFIFYLLLLPVPVAARSNVAV